MSACIRVLAAAPLLLLPAAASASDSRPLQYVIISFDGANDNALWARSLKLGDETGARFTYFLSCVYLLSAEDRALYRGPGMKTGRSNVGFATSKADAAARLATSGPPTRPGMRSRAMAAAISTARAGRRRTGPPSSRRSRPSCRRDGPSTGPRPRRAGRTLRPTASMASGSHISPRRPVSRQR